MRFTKPLLLGCLLFLGLSALGQELSISLGKTDLPLNEYFTITITAKNGRIRDYQEFPDINGFIKRGIQSSSNTSYINGQISTSHSISQNYQAQRKGTFVIRPFKMVVNGETLTADGSRVNVTDAVERSRRDPFSGLDDPFDPATTTEFLDVKADAFLAFSMDKKEVYVGEGFTGTLAFYVAETNRAEMRFHELGPQVTEIVKKLKPENCWEENYQIEKIAGEPITLNNKRYTQFKIYQATFYPLSTIDVEFPSVGLELIKYNVARNPTFFGRNRQEDFKTFYSAPKTIKVKELPPHPLKESVPVGVYKLDEKLSDDQVETGQSFNYTFRISGYGNISAIKEPTLPNQSDFEFYAPNVRQNIRRSGITVSGNKSFEYYAIPQEPGNYNLRDYFNWIYFNTSSESYDTLFSRKQLLVTGTSKKNQNILSNDVGSFYDRITTEDNTLSSINKSDYLRVVTTGLIFLMFAFSAYIIYRKA